MRLAFARKYRHWTVRQWSKILFTDECSVEIGKIYHRKIWSKPENQYKKGFFLPVKRKFGKKYIKIWYCMTYSGVGRLQFIEDGWNRHVYKKFLDENLLLKFLSFLYLL